MIYGLIVVAIIALIVLAWVVPALFKWANRPLPLGLAVFAAPAYAQGWRGYWLNPLHKKISTLWSKMSAPEHFSLGLLGESFKHRKHHKKSNRHMNASAEHFYVEPAHNGPSAAEADKTLSNWDEGTRQIGLEPSIYESHKRFVNDASRVSTTASNVPVPTADNYPIPYVGLRRPEFYSGTVRKEANVVPTVEGDQLPRATSFRI